MPYFLNKRQTSNESCLLFQGVEKGCIRNEWVKDPVFKAISKYKNHPSIIAIKEKSKNAKFSFHEINNEKIEKEIRKLNKNKASQKSDIPSRMIKDNANIFAQFLCETVKSAIKTSNFSNSLKLTDIAPLHKKDRKENKENCGLVSILPIKIFERILFGEMSGFFHNFLSEQQHGFRKGYSKQQCFLNLLEKSKIYLIRVKLFGALLADLSKAFDCLDH